MDVDAELRLNPKTMGGLKRIPDAVLYTIAKETLDYSQPITPMSKMKNHAGTLRRETASGGVKGSNGDYYIGSYTNYAKYVWKMPSSTNWTTPNTNNKWFVRALKEHQATIIDNAINKAWRKEML